MSIFKKKMSVDEEIEFDRLRMLKEVINSQKRLGVISNEEHKELGDELIRQSYVLEEKYD